jgi:hypothetical protein
MEEAPQLFGQRLIVHPQTSWVEEFLAQIFLDLSQLQHFTTPRHLRFLPTEQADLKISSSLFQYLEEVQLVQFIHFTLAQTLSHTVETLLSRGSLQTVTLFLSVALVSAEHKTQME